MVRILYKGRWEYPGICRHHYCGLWNYTVGLVRCTCDIWILLWYYLCRSIKVSRAEFSRGFLTVGCVLPFFGLPLYFIIILREAGWALRKIMEYGWPECWVPELESGISYPVSSRVVLSHAHFWVCRPLFMMIDANPGDFMEPGTGIIDLSPELESGIVWPVFMIFQPRVVSTTMSHVRVLCTLSSPTLDLVFSTHKRPYWWLLSCLVFSSLILLFALCTVALHWYLMMLSRWWICWIADSVMGWWRTCSCLGLFWLSTLLEQMDVHSCCTGIVDIEVRSGRYYFWWMWMTMMQE